MQSIKLILTQYSICRFWRFRKQTFWEDPLFPPFNPLLSVNDFILILKIMVSSIGGFPPTFPKKEEAMYQYCLIPPEDIPPSTRYEKLFENLPEIPENKSQWGRPPISRQSLLKGLIYRNLRGINKLVELEFELINNPSMAKP